MLRSLLANGRCVRRKRPAIKADIVLQVGKAPDVDPILVEILYSIRLPHIPTWEINVHSEPSSDLAHDLLTADLDLALITDPAKNPKLTMNKLVETPLLRRNSLRAPTVREGFSC